MEIVVKGRSEGKTRRVLEWFVEDPDTRIVVVQNQGLVINFRHLIRETVPNVSYLHTQRVFDANFFAHHMRGVNVADVAIDDADILVGRQPTSMAEAEKIALGAAYRLGVCPPEPGLVTMTGAILSHLL
jgi:hypothetical protein